MKNRIVKNCKAVTKKAKPDKEVRLTEEQWEQVDQPVAPSKRVTISVKLALPPIQWQALQDTSRYTTVTPEEIIVGGLVLALDCYNSDDFATYKYGIVASAVCAFPEREKELGQLCDAQARAFDAKCEVERLSSRVREMAVAS